MVEYTGEFHHKKDDEPGSSTTAEHHWRASLTADHYNGAGTAYDEIPDDDWTRFYVSGWFTEEPVSPYGTDIDFEDYHATIEVRDGDRDSTKTSLPEPDPDDSPSEMVFDLSISFALGPVDITHTLQTNNSIFHDDTWNGNDFWHHWEVPTIGLPIGSEDSYGASVVLDTKLQPGDEETIAGWTSSLYSYTDPSWGGTAFQETDAIGGFCDFTVVDDDA